MSLKFIISAQLLLLSIAAFCQRGILLNHETHISIGLNVVEEESFLYEIYDKDAEWIGHIGIPQNGKERVKILEAYVMDASGKIIRNLKKKDITFRSNVDYSELHSDSYIYEFRLNHFQYPYRIFYKYRTTYSDWLGIRWYPMSDSRIPTNAASLSIEFPADQTINFKHHADIEHEFTTEAERSRHVWTVAELPVYIEEDFAPPLAEVIPHVKAIPESFQFGIEGSSQSWQDFGAWKSELISGLGDLPPGEASRLKKLTENLNARQAVEAVYYYLQDHHRYIYVGVELGGLQPYPPSYVVQNRYGDCKALTNYMKSALAALGIESYYTTIFADENPVRVDTSFAGHQSNHVILCVPMGEDTIWLENTSNCDPFNFLGTFTQNRMALVVNGDQSRLVKTPALGLEDVANIQKLYFTISDDSTLVSFQTTLRGSAYETLNYLIKNDSKERQTRFVRELMSLKSASLDQWKVVFHRREEPKIVIQGTMTLGEYTSKIGHSVLIPVPPLDFPHLERPETRVNALRFSYPIAEYDTMIFNLKNLENIKLPQSSSHHSKFGSYDLHVQKQDNKVVLTRKFEIPAGDYDIEEYEKFYNFMDGIRSTESNTVILINQNE